MRNSEIRYDIQQSGFKHWMIAEKIGVNEVTFCRWLRVPLTPEKKKLVYKAIEQLKEEGGI